MDSIRTLIRNNGRLAACLLGAALLFKLLVPAGYMVTSDNMVLTVVICSDSTGEQLTREISVPMKGTSGAEHEKGKNDCPYTGLAKSAVAGVDLALLASAIAFVLALAFAPQISSGASDTPRLRPPSRGPPLAA
ncbi:hypothetical protein C8024_18130 [Sphingopyxis sp. BSNA05]|uniref:DUF2946 family protein n=1 Tax=Sphingopyxis sp. BSNA05 TaxID=1236614 RepID=UPI0015638DA3|nr:DUF2946 family protein [Sphingopyxis sp. BSNA05]NRD90959.1 hypothetical protein [Sphingopyxis sp. BSNA05]